MQKVNPTPAPPHKSYSCLQGHDKWRGFTRCGVKYYLNPQGEFIIENYNSAKPFANFFPGIAGKYGIPMWVFYVNRGQAIISFGSKDRDHAILEFFPANRAWQLAPLQGFRTFIKILSGNKPLFYEPFHSGFVNLNFNLSNQMSITAHTLKLEEENLSLGLKIKVEYFTIPQDSYAALVRILTVANIGKKSKKMQLLDGLPQIIPYGTSNLFLKKLSRTIEAWMKVENLELGVPFYKLDVDPTDRPEVIHIHAGNFYLGFHYEKEKIRLIKPIVDPQTVFGRVSDFSWPQQFFSTKFFKTPTKEIVNSKTPCGFSLANLQLVPGEEKTFYFVTGYMRNKEILNLSLKKITAPGYLADKKSENKNVISGLQRDIFTASASREFNLYAQQTYLDNIIRGGYPVIFGEGEKKTVFYLYSRKHGDLERDYNKFQLEPAYFSQGNGNYRDLNQNRRCDIWFNPDIEDKNIIDLFNLIQADGFNPLVIKGARFILNDEKKFRARLKESIPAKDITEFMQFLNKPFTPGEVITFLEDNHLKIKTSYDDFLDTLLTSSLKIQDAEHGEGFWTDHWHYNLDLLENYLLVYPEKTKEIIFEKKVFTFYDNYTIVRPRAEKYLLYNGLPRQLQAVTSCLEKKEIIGKRSGQSHTVRTRYGQGEIYQTTLINKLLCILVNKLASLDPFGCGIEMEADKPNWFDALNGLPALFGSSICETFELKRLILFIQDALEKSRVEKIYLTEEIRDFLFGLNDLLEEGLSGQETVPFDSDYQYWDKSSSLKEDYRHKTRFGFSGQEIQTNVSQLLPILSAALKKIETALKKAYAPKKNVYYAYFINEVKEYRTIKDNFIQPTKFIQKKLPLFLEGQMHALRLAKPLAEAKKIHRSTKKSSLYDRKLKMYKATASLKSMPEEIGRCRVFTPGWLENESIWLHMEYKYLLEMLKNGLYAEFYADFKNVLIPFQPPSRYGRNILENSSFLVSSAFPDKDLHGNGFVARLSGSTAEFLNIWLIMNVGEAPFRLNQNNELNLQFSPILAGWLFGRKGQYSFNFLGKVLVTYHNPKRKDTFGKNAVKIKKITFADQDNKPVEITGDTIPSPYASQIRSRQVKQIDIFFD